MIKNNVELKMLMFKLFVVHLGIFWNRLNSMQADPLSAKNSKKALVRQGFFVSVGSVLQKCYINFAKEGLVRILREIFYSLRHEMHDFGCHGHE